MSSPEDHEVSCLGFGKKRRSLRVWSAGDKVVVQAPPGEVAFLSDDEVDLVISALIEARKRARQADPRLVPSGEGVA
ncbi:MAG: hypothetical protein JOZ47_01365 [Kutzneria sp.]|nr:hypothetical protein [Kutzneria sp.]MBV9843711.1 hypothetical protein [Kutzneria sp.]